jgi:hypothetical protein
MPKYDDGKLEMVDEDWIMERLENSDHWLYRSCVLLCTEYAKTIEHDHRDTMIDHAGLISLRDRSKKDLDPDFIVQHWDLNPYSRRLAYVAAVKYRNILLKETINRKIKGYTKLEGDLEMSNGEYE